MAHTKAVDCEISGVDDPSFRQWDKLQRDRRPSLAPEAREHPGDDLASALAALTVPGGAGTLGVGPPVLPGFWGEGRAPVPLAFGPLSGGRGIDARAFPVHCF